MLSSFPSRLSGANGQNIARHLETYPSSLALVQGGMAFLSYEPEIGVRRYVQAFRFGNAGLKFKFKLRNFRISNFKVLAHLISVHQSTTSLVLTSTPSTTLRARE